jgi:hypothetical protein
MSHEGIFILTVNRYCTCTERMFHVDCNRTAQPDAGADGTLTVCTRTPHQRRAVVAAYQAETDSVGAWTSFTAYLYLYGNRLLHLAQGTDVSMVSAITTNRHRTPDVRADGTLTVCPNHTNRRAVVCSHNRRTGRRSMD